jgi:hypothetical protein
MKTIRMISAVLFVIILNACIVACSDDDEKEITTVVVDENGKTSGDVKFVQIDDKNFYINDIKYTIKQGHLAVTGYDIGFSGHANILSELEYRGTTLKVLEISSDAFYNCTALTSISIPESVIEIGDHAFAQTSLKEITIPKNVKELYDGVIPESLNTITIGSTETIISEYALGRPKTLNIIFLSGEKLSGCILYGNVNSVVFPNSLKEIDWLNIYGVKSFEIPKTVTKINELVFLSSSLEYFSIPESVKEIGELHFVECPLLTGVSIPESVKKIGSLGFRSCTSLTSFTIPNSVASIGEWAFNGCTSLDSVVIPNSVTSIDDNAFEGCISLNSVTIPNSVTSIGGNVFTGCTSLASVVSLRETPCNIDKYSFYGINNNVILYVPVGCRKNYINNDNWKKYFKRIVEGTPDNIYYESIDLGLPSGTLWAACNIGASGPEDYGDYFAWGEIEGYNDGKKEFSWSTYKWCNGSENTLTKYNTNRDYGTVDKKTELDPEDDAAYVNWGPEWRMPSLEQLQELINSNYTTTSWTKLNGVYGCKITSKKNGNFIFLPTAGLVGESILDGITYLDGIGEWGFYWSRSLLIDSRYSRDCRAHCLWLDSYNSPNFYMDVGNRNCGQSVRPVRSPE